MSVGREWAMKEEAWEARLLGGSLSGMDVDGEGKLASVSGPLGHHKTPLLECAG